MQQQQQMSSLTINQNGYSADVFGQGITTVHTVWSEDSVEVTWSSDTSKAPEEYW